VLVGAICIIDVQHILAENVDECLDLDDNLRTKVCGFGLCLKEA